MKRGQISIKITKPKLTINGFEIEKEDVQAKKPKTSKRRTSSPTAKS